MVAISSFREALGVPQKGFTRMAHLRWVGESVRRSTYFAEAEVECDGEHYLIYMPLTLSSLKRVERLVPLHRHLITSYVPRLEILRSEMHFTDSVGREATCDILREPLPAGEPFTDAVAAVADEMDAHRLINAINELQGALLCADLSHNAVREENIILTEKGEARLVRWYYATEGAGGDDEAFEGLRERIRSQVNMVVRDAESAQYNVAPMLDNHLYVRPLHEGLAAVEEPSGWGFVDSENQVVIEPVFRWVGDFYEGRAEVESESGMGLINREGEFVILPIYDSVEYDYHSGCTRAWIGEECLLFDYEGKRVGALESACDPPPTRSGNVLRYNNIAILYGEKDNYFCVRLPYGGVLRENIGKYAG